MSRKKWTQEETTKLIMIYEENEVLWNTLNKDYRNREKKYQIVEEIARSFDCTPAEVHRKIHNLRNQVSQELRKIDKRKRSGTDENYTSNWTYFSSLKFLIPVMTACSTQSNVESREDAEKHVMVSIETDIKKQKMVVMPKRKHEEAKNEKIYKNALGVLQKEPDEYDTFGQYVASELRSLRNYFNKRRLKSEIRKSIARIADEDDLYSPSTSSAVPSMCSTPEYSQ